MSLSNSLILQTVANHTHIWQDFYGARSKVYILGWVEKSKLLKNILGHVDPVVIHKIRDFPPNRFIL